MNLKETLRVLLIYLAVSTVIFISSLASPSKVFELQISTTFVSLILLIPLFIWYKRCRGKLNLSLETKAEKGFVLAEVLVMFSVAMAIRIPMVLLLGMAYEKTAIVYLVVLTILLIKRNYLEAYGFKTEGFVKLVLVGLAYYLAWALPLFGMLFGLTYTFTDETLFTSYNPLIDVFIFPFMTLCVGISEEGLFRGFMQTRLAKAYGGRKALFTQALLFGVWHFVWHVSPFNPIGMLFHVLSTFIFGLAFGWFYKESGTLVPLILTHGLIDTVGAGAVLNPKLEQMEGLIQSFQFASFAVSIFILILLTKPLARKARTQVGENIFPRRKVAVASTTSTWVNLPNNSLEASWSTMGLYV